MSKFKNIKAEIQLATIQNYLKKKYETDRVHAKGTFNGKNMIFDGYSWKEEKKFV